MFLNKIVLTVAAAAGMTLTALAVSPKTDSKATTEASTSNATNAKEDVDTYYWFATNSAGTALADPSGIPASQSPQEVGPCDGHLDFCARGYTADQTMISGTKRVLIVSVTSSAEEAHKEN